uniref:Uncharacterized protein n=1 Tax=Manihot esculenta TaxID=3983 RepID=A0A2C9UGZ7_MANES
MKKKGAKEFQMQFNSSFPLQTVQGDLYNPKFKIQLVFISR